jgi:mono/diheme cytochrome c family protein
MSGAKPRTSLFYYIPILLIAAVIVGVVFVRNFQRGEQAGQNAGPGDATHTQGNASGAINEQAMAKDIRLAAKGKALFAVNCATCHGPQGLGNGDRAASLTPKPRNFHVEKFKFGNDIVSLHNTILKGSPGTSMPSFVLLPLEETWALAHYVSTLIPNPPPITDQLVASLPGASSTGASKPATTPADTNKETARIPIQVAMQRLAVPEPTGHGTARVNSSLPGAAIYAQHCAGCHGERGEGKAVRVLSVAPYRYEMASSLAASTSPALRDRNKFAEVVTKGLPGKMMPGQATLTAQQIDDLFTFVRSLQSP